MPHRIVTISDHIDSPSGFGVQHRHLAFALAAAGYEVHSLGLWDSRPLAALSEPPAGSKTCRRLLTRYPGGMGVEDHRRAWAMYRDLLRPDLVITLGDLEMFRHLNDEPHRPFAWCHWLPLDALPYPAPDHDAMLRYDHLVLMSRFGLHLVRPHLEGRVPLHYIPHGVDTRVFRPHEDPLALRRRWGRRLGVEMRPDDFILIARDANQWRKQQPLLIEALAKLPPDVKLILHCHPVAHPNANGWDLPRVARLYGVADRVIFTSPPPDPLAPAQLAELDNLADLRVSATQGEGFGVITIEAMACGTPTLITNYTTSPELLLATPAERILHFPQPPPRQPKTDNPTPSPLDPFGPAGELVRVAAWTIEQRRHLLRPLIDTDDLAARVLALRADRARLLRYAIAGLRRVLASYALGRIAAQWASLLRRILGRDP